MEDDLKIISNHCNSLYIVMDNVHKLRIQGHIKGLPLDVKNEGMIRNVGKCLENVNMVVCNSIGISINSPFLPTMF